MSSPRTHTPPHQASIAPLAPASSVRSSRLTLVRSRSPASRIHHEGENSSFHRALAIPHVHATVNAGLPGLALPRQSPPRMPAGASAYRHRDPSVDPEIPGTTDPAHLYEFCPTPLAGDLRVPRIN